MQKLSDMCVEKGALKLRFRARTPYLLNQDNVLKTKDQKGCPNIEKQNAI